MSNSVTWGTYKGERGYWEWRDGVAVFTSARQPVKKKSNGLQIIKDIEPYQNIGVDNGVIGSRRQHRDMLRAHGLYEVGNEKPRESPLQRYVADRATRPDPKIVELLKKNSGGKWL